MNATATLVTLPKPKTSFFVVRNGNVPMSYHSDAKSAMRWLASHRPGESVRTILDSGFEVTKSFTAAAWYSNKDNSKVFDPEFQSERGTYTKSLNTLLFWTHQSWEQDRENHPSPSGRSQAWERWHDVIALMRIADLTLNPNPTFSYDFGQLSPPEGKGYRLKIAVFPTPEAMLQEMVSHDV
jgi:hypothetical protein